MNKILSIIFLLLATMLVVVKGQSINTNEYIGKWNAVINGTPGGGSKLEVNIHKENGKLEGTVTSKDDGTVEIKKIEVNESSISVYFKHGWFTVDLEMEKTDRNHCKCKLADRYTGLATKQDV